MRESGRQENSPETASSVEQDVKLRRRLILRTLDGDEAAASCLFDYYHKVLFAVAARWSRDEAEDWLQEAWLRWWRNRRSFALRAAGDPLFPWFCVALRNLAIGNWRAATAGIRGAGAPHVPLDGIDLQDPLASSTDDRIWLDELLEAVSTVEREVVILRHVQGRTLAEIAEIYGLTSQRIGQISQSAKRKIREAK